MRLALSESLNPWCRKVCGQGVALSRDRRRPQGGEPTSVGKRAFVGKTGYGLNSFSMDLQEAIDSLRNVLESAITPGVESWRLWLEALEKDLQEHGQSIDRLDARVDRLTGRKAGTGNRGPVEAGLT